MGNKFNARYINTWEFTRLSYNGLPQSWVWRSTRGLSAHWGAEGCSGEPGAQSSVLCESASGGLRLCALRLKCLCQKAGDNIPREGKESLQETEAILPSSFPFYSNNLPLVGLPHPELHWANLVGCFPLKLTDSHHNKVVETANRLNKIDHIPHLILYTFMPSKISIPYKVLRWTWQHSI